MQLVEKFCIKKGIAHKGLGPVIFEKGFTRDFLDGRHGTNQDLLQRVLTDIKKIGNGKKVVVVDGIAYPSCGSVVGLNSADVCKLVGGKLLLVEKSGVGDAIDSFNRDYFFLASQQVEVRGVVFNRFSWEGFYNLKVCQEYIIKYFQQNASRFPLCSVFGFVPEIDFSSEIQSQKEENGEGKEKEQQEKEEEFIMQKIIQTFQQHISFDQLLKDLSLEPPPNKK